MTPKNSKSNSVMHSKPNSYSSAMLRKCRICNPIRQHQRLAGEENTDNL